jgi:hypothetical protein
MESKMVPRSKFFCSPITVFVAIAMTAVVVAQDAPQTLVSGVPAEQLAANPQLEAASFDLSGWLDDRFDTIWRDNGVQPELCDDGTYMRRVSVDLIGRIPSVVEYREFAADVSPDKRARLVDKLLVSPDASAKNQRMHAEHLARIWRRIMIPAGTNGAAMGPAVEPWLTEQFELNRPYNEFAHSVVAAVGDEANRVQPLYAAFGGTPEAYATEISRVFLGVRIGCAQCHDHPFASWKQTDFWGIAAFYAGATMQPAPDGGAEAAQPMPVPVGRITHDGKEYQAKVLWSTEPVKLESGDPREVLADWITSGENLQFAATTVNRVWQHLLGRGLIAEVDDLDLASQEDRAVVLDDLARMFIKSGYDLRWLIAGICKSRAYQCRSVVANTEADSILMGVRPLKTLSPEQMFDSLEQALMLPRTQANEESARHNGAMAQLVQRLDESITKSPEEYGAGVPQVLLLMNGAVMNDATDLSRSKTLRAVVDAPFFTDSEKLETLFLAAVSRKPTDQEQQKLLEHVSSQPEEDRGQAYAEVFWALLNSPEFVLCR